jgi:hypothetical protein
MLSYRRVNASWLPVAELRRSQPCADALICIAAIPGNYASPAGIRAAASLRILYHILHRSHRSVSLPRFLAPRLRW